MIKIPAHPYLLYLRPCDDLEIGASVLGSILSLELEDVKDYTCRRTTDRTGVVVVVCWVRMLDHCPRRRWKEFPNTVGEDGDLSLVTFCDIILESAIDTDR